MIDVSGVAQRMLAAITAHFTANDWDLPERRYVAAGSPNILAADDEHLAVALSSMTSGAGAHQAFGTLSRAAGTQGPPRATITARLMRCVPVIDDSGEPPDAAELNEAGVRLLRDPGRLIDALYTWRQTELQALNPNPQVEIGNVEVIGPMGGLAGHAVPVTISPVQ